uniref:Uncharacterized protein n=1 Tax=Caenorhabditis japonica TaxID=281687 RepID=A0A8R1HV58_CAEJA
MLSSKLFVVIIVLFCTLLSVNAQFFFPFAMGQNNAVPNYNYGGSVYGNGNAVKDSEGYFVKCSGWTCQN